MLIELGDHLSDQVRLQRAAAALDQADDNDQPTAAISVPPLPVTGSAPDRRQGKAEAS